MERSAGDCLTLAELHAGLSLGEGDDWELNHNMRDVPGSSSTESSADPEEGHDLSWCGRLWSMLWGGLSGW